MYNCKLWYFKTIVFQNCIHKQALSLPMVHIRVIAGVGVADRFMYEAVSLGLFGSAFS
jgi:hypothetical protein